MRRFPFTIMLATHRPELEAQAAQSLAAFPLKIVRGNNFPSCSKLWNECILQCPTERVIICNEKARPARPHIDKLNTLLNFDYALVGLYLFGLFGLDKELIRRIGFFDERYLGGWYEDNDFALRLHEHNLAAYYSTEAPYLLHKSSWNHDQATAHFRKKWKTLNGGGASRLLPEESYPYDLGPNRPHDFLPFDETVAPPHYQWMYPTAKNPAMQPPVKLTPYSPIRLR